MNNFLILIFVTTTNFIYVSAQIIPIPKTRTTYGNITGAYVIIDANPFNFKKYSAFRGIPYAAPPIGPLRFADPKPPAPWTGVRDCSKFGSSCHGKAMFGGSVTGSEDCLFLNVYTPDEAKGSRAVMVFIHGGAFAGGDGTDSSYGAKYLILNDIVLVTLNYRLGLFGFLCTGDSASPGNYGLKDQIMALKWVKSNIAYFGGDPNKITIFGESAGSVSVSYLVLSPAVKGLGLFQQAIMESGMATLPWAFQSDPMDNLDLMARKINIAYTTTTELVTKFRQLSPAVLMNALQDFLLLRIPKALRPFEAAPCLDGVVVTKRPIVTLRSGLYNKIPMIVGFNSAESLFSILDVGTGNDKTTQDTFVNNPSFFAPLSYNVSCNDPRIKTFVRELYNTYFGGGLPSYDKRDKWVDLMTDLQFRFQIDRAVQVHAGSMGQPPLYYYRFSYDGALNWARRIISLLLLGDPKARGVMHSEELFYLFDMTSNMFLNFFSSTEADNVRIMMAKLWTDFAKTGNPTPPGSIYPAWTPYTSTNMKFYDIYAKPVMNGTISPGLALLQKYQRIFNPLDL